MTVFHTNTKPQKALSVIELMKIMEEKYGKYAFGLLVVLVLWMVVVVPSQAVNTSNAQALVTFGKSMEVASEGFERASIRFSGVSNAERR